MTPPKIRSGVLGGPDDNVDHDHMSDMISSLLKLRVVVLDCITLVCWRVARSEGSSKGFLMIVKGMEVETGERSTRQRFIFYKGDGQGFERTCYGMKSRS